MKTGLSLLANAYSSKRPIPLKFPDLVVIFLLRTLITLPVIAATAYWVVF